MGAAWEKHTRHISECPDGHPHDWIETTLEPVPWMPNMSTDGPQKCTRCGAEQWACFPVKAVE